MIAMYDCKIKFQIEPYGTPQAALFFEVVANSLISDLNFGHVVVLGLFFDVLSLQSLKQVFPRD